MNVLIVHAHPNPSSFNASMTRRAAESLKAGGAAVVISDLYAEGFDPVEHPRHYSEPLDAEAFSPLAEQRRAYKAGRIPADVQREIERLEWSDLVILQFPLWWHAQPAILKGWYDRVFLSGGLYTSKMRYDTGYFRGRRAVCSVTSGAPAAAFGPGGRGGDIETLLWPIQYSLHYMGFSLLPPMLSFGVQGHGFSYQTEDDLARHLQEKLDAWGARAPRLAEEKPLRFPGWSDWDEEGRSLAEARH